MLARVAVELEGRYIKPPKLTRREGKLALSTIQFIDCLYVLRNAHDAVIGCTIGPICISKERKILARSEDI
jgi:hypothetical protein